MAQRTFGSQKNLNKRCVGSALGECISQNTRISRCARKQVLGVYLDPEFQLVHASSKCS